MADDKKQNESAVTNVEKAPRAGMQGKVERGAAPTQTLPRPGSGRNDGPDASEPHEQDSLPEG
jgi:hypothetical protein